MTLDASVPRGAAAAGAWTPSAWLLVAPRAAAAFARYHRLIGFGGGGVVSAWWWHGDGGVGRRVF